MQQIEVHSAAVLFQSGGFPCAPTPMGEACWWDALLVANAIGRLSVVQMTWTAWFAADGGAFSCCVPFAAAPMGEVF